MIPAIYKTLPYDPVKSLAPVTRITTSGLALVVHPQVPVKSVREFVHLARQGMSAAGGPPERFRALLISELARGSRVVEAAKIKID